MTPRRDETELDPYNGGYGGTEPERGKGSGPCWGGSKYKPMTSAALTRSPDRRSPDTAPSRAASGGLSSRSAAPSTCSSPTRWLIYDTTNGCCHRSVSAARAAPPAPAARRSPDGVGCPDDALPVRSVDPARSAFSSARWCPPGLHVLFDLAIALACGSEHGTRRQSPRLCATF
jgi:hypothetical protein